MKRIPLKKQKVKLKKKPLRKKPLKKLKLKKKKLKDKSLKKKLLKKRKAGKGLKFMPCGSCGNDVEVGQGTKKCICRKCTSRGISFKDLED